MAGACPTPSLPPHPILPPHHCLPLLACIHLPPVLQLGGQNHGHSSQVVSPCFWLVSLTRLKQSSTCLWGLLSSSSVWPGDHLQWSVHFGQRHSPRWQSPIAVCIFDPIVCCEHWTFQQAQCHLAKWFTTILLSRLVSLFTVCICDPRLWWSLWLLFIFFEHQWWWHHHCHPSSDQWGCPLLGSFICTVPSKDLFLFSLHMLCAGFRIHFFPFMAFHCTLYPPIVPSKSPVQLFPTHMDWWRYAEFLK